MTATANRDIELIDRYLSGDVDAFSELVTTHQDRVFAICLRMLRDRDAALDVTQETFLTLLRKADRYKAQAAFTTWLYRVTMNACYDYLRKQKRRQAEQLPETFDPPDVHATDALDAVELRPDIESALLGLAPEFRAAVVLVDVEGMSLEQASDTLGVPSGTIKSRLFRARRQLAQSLGNLRPGFEHPTDDTGA